MNYNLALFKISDVPDKIKNTSQYFEIDGSPLKDPLALKDNLI